MSPPMSRGLPLEYERVLHEDFLVAVLMYGVRKWGGRNQKDLEFRLYRWMTLGIFWMCEN